METLECELRDGGTGVLKLQEKILHGRHGEVWRSSLTDADGNERGPVAVKMGACNSAEMQSEIKLLFGLPEHECLVRVYGHALIDLTPTTSHAQPRDQTAWYRLKAVPRTSMSVLVMELCEQDTLTMILAEALDEAVVRVIALTVARALHHCHAYGVTHMDVKPENVLKRRDGTYALADFSCATRDETWKLGPAGTAAYMAPELNYSSRWSPVATKPTDVYSLGAFAFGALTGRALNFNHDGCIIWSGSDDKEYNQRCAQISPLAQDFVNTLVVRDSKLRPTIEQVLTHPWLAAPPTAPLAAEHKDENQNENENQNQNHG